MDNTKTKVRVKITNSSVKQGDVGYIDGYVNFEHMTCACVVIGSKIVRCSIYDLDVIDEATFKKEDQNTFVTVK